MKRIWTLWYISLSPLFFLVLVWVLGCLPAHTHQGSRSAPSRRFFPSFVIKRSKKSSLTALYHLDKGRDEREHGDSPTQGATVTPGSASDLTRTKTETDHYTNKNQPHGVSSGLNSAVRQPTVLQEQKTDKKYQGYSFKFDRSGSLSYADSPQCPGIPHSPPEQLPPVEGQINFLLILGAQKAGTTWLFDALETHPLFSGAEHGYRRGLGDPWRKEVHFFDFWPVGTTQDYLSCFSDQHLQTARAGGPHVLVDATPGYLYTPAAAARVKQVLPHAKFVIILRDPAERVFSSWKMLHRLHCSGSGENGTEVACPVPSLAQMAREVLPDSARPPECLFYSAAGTHTWGDCWSCSFAVVNRTACGSDGATEAACQHLTGMANAHVSNYAPQIAWWLSFFPPERFLVFTSQQLRAPDQQVQVLNKIRHHVGLDAASPFKHEQISNISGFVGGYSEAMDPEDAAAVESMRTAFDVAAPALQRLMDDFFPGQGFVGFDSA